MIYKILQIKNPKECPYLFMDYEFAKDHNFKLEDYEVVWQGDTPSSTHTVALDKLFEEFNIRRPKDFKGHSLSVSDIIQINGINYYCEPAGWTTVNKMKIVNLAKALTKNSNCWGFIYPVANGLYQYQNDNDLGLDLEALDGPAYYIKKVFITGRYYAYLLLQGNEYVEDGVPLETVKALLHECHKHWIPLSTEEENLCKEYWAQY